MLDQSFSTANFRKIVDIENRKGIYLEGEFFPDVEKKSKEIQLVKSELRTLKQQKKAFTEDEYESKKAELSTKFENLKEQKEELLTGELEVISSKVNSKGFTFGIKEVDIGTPKKAFVAERNPATFFALKQIQHNIRRLYKVKQANRHQIVSQLRELLGDKFPKYILRTDISSFYESIPRKQLLEKLRDDPLLTLASKKIIRRILFEYSAITGNDVGLPRGIGISAYLAELYMREIDRTIRDYPGVLYYARYVDDIFIIFCPPPNIGTRLFRRTVVNEFKNLGLKRNRKKTQIITTDSGVTHSVQYLGYKFSIGSGPVELRMTDKKIRRYKQRIDLTFSAYDKKSRMPKKYETKARSLLEKRVRFLTSNTRLVNNKKNVVSGIFFSNSLLTELSDLSALDSYLSAKISGLSSTRLKNRLSSQSFAKGFQTRRYHKFSAHDLCKIVEVWKHVS
ncbi:MAG: RNA-directed DNA polymerase [Ignavibacteriaceae bacterium]|nr:RNA-directed DNA polymerase [Ignavibacteriaceae bacterium]